MKNAKKYNTLEIVDKTNQAGICRQAEIQCVSEEDRTIELSFSSENSEVSRWFGLEKLDHSPGSVRLERINQGGAVLVNHNNDDLVGVIEKAWIDSKDKKGRALVRFSKSIRAQEIFEDVKDRIRPNVSVYYIIHNIKLLEERSDSEDRYLVTDWEPAEISIVSVPADITVGVGRNATEVPPVEKSKNNMKLLNKRESEINMSVKTEKEQTTTAQEKVVVQETERSNKSDSKIISQMGRQYGDMEMALKFIEEGRSSSEFQAALLEKLSQQKQKPLRDVSSADIGLNKREVEQFSFVKAIRSLANPGDPKLRDLAGFEYECSRAASKKLSKTAQGILVPYDVLSRTINSSITGLNPGDTGGHLIGTQHLAGSFIDFLRNRTVVMKMAMVLSGLVGDIDIPKQIKGGNGYWLGEDEDAPESTLEFGQVKMNPKTVGSYIELTRKLLNQATPDIENLARTDIARALATTIDFAAFYGTGINNQPLGITNTTGINVQTFNSTNPGYADIVAMESKIAADNADVNNMSYTLNPLMRGHCKTTQKFPNSTSEVIWETGDTLNGYRTEVTNQIKDGDIVFGNFANLVIGMWGGLDLTVDPYSRSKSGALRIVAFQDVDFALRYAQSFCLARKEENINV
ncbi:MAG: phage major capsid protein [Desulfobacteraceae bacterium]|nr:phage major capsid protein [Desulfobacteraceae bacterium]